MLGTHLSSWFGRLNHQNQDVSSAVAALSPERTDELATSAVVALGREKSQETEYV